MASREGQNMISLTTNFKSMAHVPKLSIRKDKSSNNQISEHYLTKHTIQSNGRLTDFRFLSARTSALGIVRRIDNPVNTQ